MAGKKEERYDRKREWNKRKRKNVWKARSGSAYKIEIKKNKRVSKEK